MSIATVQSLKLLIRNEKALCYTVPLACGFTVYCSGYTFVLLMQVALLCRLITQLKNLNEFLNSAMMPAWKKRLVCRGIITIYNNAKLKWLGPCKMTSALHKAAPLLVLIQNGLYDFNVTRLSSLSN